MNLRPPNQFSRLRAFTLIELLAVIAIIGIITAMIVQLAPAVNQNKKRQRVEAEKNKLLLLIDNYQSKFGHYPPDNAYLSANLNPYPLPLSRVQYDDLTQVNPLLYELTGGTNNYNGKFYDFNGSNFSQSEIGGAFGFQEIQNADAQQQVIFKPFPAPNVYLSFPSWLLPTAKDTAVQGLIVPVEMIQASDSKNASGVANTATVTNFWHYDASSTNRHNLSSYDLWAEFVVGKNKHGWIYVTNGNW